MRYYSEISKELFLEKVKKLMNEDEYPYEMPTIIEKDLSKVNFDFENYTSFEDTKGYSTYPVGYYEIEPNFHIFFVNFGGDWEYPICAIYYWGDKKLRAYIPKDGNAWNKKERCAYGSEYNNIARDDKKIDKEVNVDAMINEIKSHILKLC